MRGSAAKKLRRVSRVLHATMVAAGTIDPPQDPLELRFQRRRLYQILKERWKQLSNPKWLDSEVASLMSNLGLPSLVDNEVNSSSNSPKPNVL